MINNAKWICVPDEFECECPDFRRNINITGILKRAILSIACVGVYECRINGKKVGDEVLTPGWSNFNDHAFVREYDVTEMITNQTELSITCGRGWGAGKIGMDVWDNVYSRKILCRYSLDLEFEDLTKSEIISDSNTEVWTSCMIYSDLYHGEIVDNTVKPYKLAMAETTEFKTKLVSFFGEKIKEQETIYPLKEIITPEGERVIDFGQNMAGYIKIRVNGNCGDRIVIRHAEVLDKDGNFYTDNMRIAKNLISYTLNGTEQEVCPRFSYQGFRYICLDECPKSIQTKDFTAIAVYSDMKRTGDFICGNDKLNKLYENIIWGQRSNFLDIPTDCPQRDERLGWTGDAQIFARTAAINYNVQKFYEKWLYELRSEQHNKIQEFSELDLKMSADILQDIKDSGDIELEMSAFTEEALNELLAQNQEGEAKEDNFDVEEELEKPCFSKNGDIWCLGKHKIICGDSTKQETYINLLGETRVNLVCTDPPYFVALQSSSGTIRNDDLNDKDGYEFLMKAFNCLHESMAKDASIYVFYATAKGRIFHDAFEDAGFKVGAGLVWKKDRLVLTRTDWKYIHSVVRKGRYYKKTDNVRNERRFPYGRR